MGGVRASVSRNMLVPFLNKNKIEAGVDEAGRGCLAGPVVAAAVVFPKGYSHPLLNDSKQLSERKRELLRPEIEKEALAYGVCFVDEKKIDEVNILNASFLAMTGAVQKLKVVPEFLLIDGNRFTSKLQIPFSCEVKGDARFMSIAAASVLAKTHRDEYMKKIASKFPGYKWDQNKGYPTKAHREAIKVIGACRFHRKSFSLLPKL